jgi:cell division inhibitor SepF
MSSMFQKALLYLGLVDEENLEEEEPQTPVITAPPLQSSIRTVPQAEPSSRGRRVEPPEELGYGTSMRVASRDDSRADVVAAVTFDDAKAVADRIRSRRPVVLNMRDTDPDMVRRLIDFASGLTYGLDGTMSKVGEGVILILPHGISLGRSETRRLAELGLYTLDDA